MMTNRIITAAFFAISAIATVCAENWKQITSSDNYYYGEGVGTTEKEAGTIALRAMLQMIAEDVVEDFRYLDYGVKKDDELMHRERVRQCMLSYESSYLPCVKTLKVSDAPNVCVRKYMERTDLPQIYTERVGRVRDMVKLADENMSIGDVGVALQNYYWAYSLLRSLQNPESVLDRNGNYLVKTLPRKIQKILSEIKADFVSREENEVFVNFTYQKSPASVNFTYYDGRKTDCEGVADGGHAYMSFASDYKDNGKYHIRLEYEYSRWAGNNDVEMRNVLAAVPCSDFDNEIVVTAKDVARVDEKGEAEISVAQTNDRPILDAAVYEKNIREVLDALQEGHLEKVYGYFAVRSLKLNNFIRQLSNRNGRIVGTPKLTLYNGANGTVVVRGLKMSFSVEERGRKTTLVDNEIFTFDSNMKICNFSFGIGDAAERDLLSKNVQWGEETRQMVLDFLENYKTAYCLKDTAYIESVFDDNATIIVGHVAKRTSRPGIAENRLSDLGREIVNYKKYTKTEYLQNLRKTFRKNQFINIKFMENDVRLLEKESGQVFAIRIRQEYNSSTYADQGYLFLLVDLTNKKEPSIKIRTWQEKPDPELGLYDIGHFFKDYFK